MKLTEVLVSLTIFVLVVVVLLETLTIFNINVQNTKKELFVSDIIIETDSKIRETIRNFEISYLENVNQKCDKQLMTLYNLDLDSAIKILEIRKEQTENNEIIIVVSWECGNKILQTVEKLNARVIIR